MKSARSTSLAFIGRVSLVCAVMSAVAMLPSAADAAPLLVGQTQFPSDDDPAPTGGTDHPLFPAITMPFVGFGFTGTLTSRVLQNDPSNPGGLTFTYRLANNSTSAHVLHRLTIGSFAGTPAITTNVTWQDPGTGVAYTLADRSTVDVIGFSFADPITGVPETQPPRGNIPPGGQSRLLVIRTNAISAATSFASVINGTVATAVSYAPVTQIPEPSTCILAAVGLVGLVGLVRRVRK